ncbi:MAG: HAD family phosphatase [Bacteroidota bacterium]
MHLLFSKISHPAGNTLDPACGRQNQPPVKNIIFDFGGVICNIDVRISEKRFVELGFKVNDPEYPAARSKQLFGQLESGDLTPRQFRDELRPFFSRPLTDGQIDDAWNALLLDIPEARIRLLEQIRSNYRIFMLTNTNEIHYLRYRETFRSQYGYDDFDDLFEKAYYSYRIGLSKPDPAIFRHLLNDSRLDPSETLFIDDTLVHVESARSVGIHAHHLRIGTGEEIMELFGKQ